MSVRVCAECVYMKPNNFSEVKFHTCTQEDGRNLVSGTPLTCVELRKERALWRCGPQGQFFKLKVSK